MLCQRNEALRHQSLSAAENRLQEHTAATAVGAVRPCEEDLYIRRPCWDILYTPNNDTVAQAIIQGIQGNNPGRVIPNSKVCFTTIRPKTNTCMLASQVWYQRIVLCTIGRYMYSWRLTYAGAFPKVPLPCPLPSFISTL